MRLARATLRSKATADGLCEMREAIKVGSVYFVDLDRVRMIEWGHTGRFQTEVRESIFVDSAVNGAGSGWFPTELLEIDGRPAGEPHG